MGVPQCQPPPLFTSIGCSMHGRPIHGAQFRLVSNAESIVTDCIRESDVFFSGIH